MDVRSMRTMAFSIVRDSNLLDAHFLRWLNMAYRQMSREYIIPALAHGDQLPLVVVTGSTQKFYLPYDFSAIISMTDQNERSLDPIPSLDVRQYGEYNSFGSFVAFYEYCSSNVTPLADSGSSPITISINNRSKTVTASAPVFTTADEMEGEFLLPLNRNSTAGAASTEDYGYRINTFTSTTVVELERSFRGVISNSGSVGDLTTGYFEVRPKNTKIIRIWGDPAADDTINLEYQRIPSMLSNDEDIPEEPRLCEAMVYKAIDLAGWAYQNAFHAKKAPAVIQEALSQFRTVAERDRLLIHNFITSNPNNRSYSQIGGIRAGRLDRFSGRGTRY